MESESNRNVWIIVGVGVMLLCFCGMVAALGWAMIFARGADFVKLDLGTAGEGQRLEQAFELGRAPELEIDNFSGSVTVRAGEGKTLTVIAIKKARRTGDLDRISVEMAEEAGRLHIKTERPRGLNSANVELQIVAPVDTVLDIDTGSGNLDVHGIQGGGRAHTGSGTITASNLGGGMVLDTGSGSVLVEGASGGVEVDTGSGRVVLNEIAGEIDAHTGSGGMEVHGAEGEVRLDTGSGTIAYEGTPQGKCRIETGSGNITLSLPADLEWEVDLETGSGTVNVDFDVEGKASRQEVVGVVGKGDQASVYAHSGSGNIDVVGR